MYIQKKWIPYFIVALSGLSCAWIAAVPVVRDFVVAPQMRTMYQTIKIGNYGNQFTFDTRNTVYYSYAFFEQKFLRGIFLLNDALRAALPEQVRQAIAGLENDDVLLTFSVLGYNARTFEGMMAPPFGGNSDAFNVVFHHVVEQFRGGSFLLGDAGGGNWQPFHFFTYIDAGVFDSNGLTAFAASGISFNRLDALQVHAHNAISPDNGRIRIEHDRHVAYGWVVGIYDPARDAGTPLLWRSRLKKRAFIQFLTLLYDAPDISAIPVDQAARMRLAAWPPAIREQPVIQPMIEEAVAGGVPGDHADYVAILRNLGRPGALSPIDLAALEQAANTIDALVRAAPRREPVPMNILRNDLGRRIDTAIDAGPYDGQMGFVDVIRESLPHLPVYITSRTGFTTSGDVFVRYYATEEYKKKNVFLYRNYSQMISPYDVAAMGDPRVEFVTYRIQRGARGVEIVRDEEKTREINALVRPGHVEILVNIVLADGSDSVAHLVSDIAAITGFNIRAQPLGEAPTDLISLNDIAARAIGGQPQGLIGLVYDDTGHRAYYEQWWLTAYAFAPAHFADPAVVVFFNRYQDRRGMQRFSVSELGALTPADDAVFDARIVEAHRLWLASRVPPAPPIVAPAPAPVVPEHSTGMPPASTLPITASSTPPRASASSVAPVAPSGLSTTVPASGTVSLVPVASEHSTGMPPASASPAIAPSTPPRAPVSSVVPAAPSVSSTTAPASPGALPPALVSSSGPVPLASSSSVSSAAPVGPSAAVAKSLSARSRALSLSDLDKRIKAYNVRIKKMENSLSATRKKLKKVNAQEAVAKRVYAQAQKNHERAAVLAKNKQTLDRIVKEKKNVMNQQATLQAQAKKMRKELAGFENQRRGLIKKRNNELRKKQRGIEKKLKDKTLNAKMRNQLKKQLGDIKRTLTKK